MSRLSVLNYVNEAVPEWAKESILMGLRGSDAHGTKLSDDDPSAVDDIDVFSVAIQPVRTYLHIDKSETHWDPKGDEIDILVYDIRKVMFLLASSNPNTVAWLWNRSEDYLQVTLKGQHLIDHREIFLTKRMLTSLSHYAHDQLRRMISRSNKYEGYMGVKRKALVDKFGYDVKFASHALRLAQLGTEGALEGTLYAYRPDDQRETIKKIKRGEYSLEEVVVLIYNALATFDEARDHASLPDEVSRPQVANLLHTILCI